ncbi:MAG: type II secretion system F family protein, partial [Oscillospiraceae bacterium]
NEVFSQLGAEVSSFTQGVLKFGGALGGWSLGLIALLVLLAVALLAFRATPGGRRALARFLAIFPPTRKLSAKIATGRFAGAMALMLSSGLDPDHSLELAGKLIDHPVLTGRIGECQKKIAEGSPFAKTLFDTRIFSGVNARMVSIGFLTGSADVVMKKLADRSEEEIDAELGQPGPGLGNHCA